MIVQRDQDDGVEVSWMLYLGLVGSRQSKKRGDPVKDM